MESISDTSTLTVVAHNGISLNETRDFGRETLLLPDVRFYQKTMTSEVEAETLLQFTKQSERLKFIMVHSVLCDRTWDKHEHQCVLYEAQSTYREQIAGRHWNC